MFRRLFLKLAPSILLLGTIAAQPIAPPVQLPAVTARPLPAGVQWRVLSYNDGETGLVSVLAETALTVTFSTDATVNGNAGCNSFMGPYGIDASNIAFGPLASTRRACLSDAANAQERAYLAALSASTSYELVGDRLTLRDADGATQVLLVRPIN